MRRNFEAAPSMRGVGVISSSSSDLASLEGIRSGLRIGRLDRLECALLAAFAAVSVWILGLDLWQVLVHGRVWTGTDGLYITDQMQYLGWIESASRHLLVANMFVIHATPADYFQPAIALSGLITRLGVAPTVTLLAWQPVAVVAMFYAVRGYARRTLPQAGALASAAVIALALFYGSFSDVYGHFGVVGDLFPGFLSWGYPFALLGVACGIFALLGYERARRAGRMAWWPGVLGALASSLHPWQGEVLALTLILTELSHGGLRAAVRAPRAAVGSLRAMPRSPRARLTAATVGLTAVPLLYYGALDRFDLSWSLGREASKHAFPAIAIALVLAPLALVALLGYRGRARGFLERTARIWPLAVVLVYLQSGSGAGATPLHAFDGITLPLAVLAVGGVQRLGWQRLRAHRVLAVTVILAFTVPTTAYEMQSASAGVAPTSGNANFITRDERAALDYLRRDPAPGGVLTRFYLGSTIPGRTGRRSYVGDCIWSEPNCGTRSTLSRALLSGQLPAAQARALVTASGARFVLSDCEDNSDLTATLRPILVSVRRFGCATVYEVSTVGTGTAGGPLAESARDAAPVRAQRRQ